MTKESTWLICGMLGLDLRVFDEWLDGLDDCPAKRQLTERRQRLDEWIGRHPKISLDLRDDESCAALKRHVEFLMIRWSEIARDDTKTPYTRLGVKYSQDQSDRGRAGADARWQGVRELSEVYEKLARRRDELGDPAPANELWPEFYDFLNYRSFRPKEIEHETDMRKDVIRWDGGKITRGAFNNKISALRN